MFFKLYAGSTSRAIPLRIKNSSTGLGLPGLVWNTSGLTAAYRREGQSAWTTITLATMTLGTWVSGGFVANGSRDGAYALGLPDAALAAGAAFVEITLYGAASMLDCDVLIELDAVNYQDAVRMGMTALPNAAAGANNGLPIVSSGAISANLSGNVTGNLLGNVTGNVAGSVGSVTNPVTVGNWTGTASTTMTSITNGLNSILSKLKRYFQLALRKDAAIATDAATELSEINENVASGAGAYDNTADSQESLRDRGDAAWTTGGAGSGGPSIQ